MNGNPYVSLLQKATNSNIGELDGDTATIKQTLKSLSSFQILESIFETFGSHVPPFQISIRVALKITLKYR